MLVRSAPPQPKIGDVKYKSRDLIQCKPCFNPFKGVLVLSLKVAISEEKSGVIAYRGTRTGTAFFLWDSDLLASLVVGGKLVLTRAHAPWWPPFESWGQDGGVELSLRKA